MKFDPFNKRAQCSHNLLTDPKICRIFSLPDHHRRHFPLSPSPLLLFFLCLSYSLVFHNYHHRWSPLVATFYSISLSLSTTTVDGNDVDTDITDSARHQTTKICTNWLAIISSTNAVRRTSRVHIHFPYILRIFPIKSSQHHCRW